MQQFIFIYCPLRRLAIRHLVQELISHRERLAEKNLDFFFLGSCYLQLSDDFRSFLNSQTTDLNLSPLDEVRFVPPPITLRFLLLLLLLVN